MMQTWMRTRTVGATTTTGRAMDARKNSSSGHQWYCMVIWWEVIFNLWWVIVVVNCMSMGWLGLQLVSFMQVIKSGFNLWTSGRAVVLASDPFCQNTTSRAKSTSVAKGNFVTPSCASLGFIGIFLCWFLCMTWQYKDHQMSYPSFVFAEYDSMHFPVPLNLPQQVIFLYPKYHNSKSTIIQKGISRCCCNQVQCIIGLSIIRMCNIIGMTNIGTIGPSRMTTTWRIFGGWHIVVTIGVVSTTTPMNIGTAGWVCCYNDLLKDKTRYWSWK